MVGSSTQQPVPSQAAAFPVKERVRRSIDALVTWVERNDYKAYDPGDGSLSYLQGWALGIHFLERVLTAVVLRTPINIRPLLGIKPHTSTKGHGYMAWGYLKMFCAVGDLGYRDRCVNCLEWLIKNKAPSYPEFCWGNAFSFSTRGGKIPAHEPTIVWSSLIGQAFMDAYEILGDARYLAVVGSICEWILKLPRLRTGQGA